MEIALDSAEVNSAKERQATNDSIIAMIKRQTNPDSAEIRAAFVDLLQASPVYQSQTFLARLGYDIALNGEVDTQTKEAVRGFEQRHGLPITSNPISPTFLAARTRASRILDENISVSDRLFVSNMWSEYVRIKGSWDEQDAPTQTSLIQCFRTSGECTEAKASVHDGKLEVDIFSYSISLWNNEEIQAVMSGVCSDDQLRIIRRSESVSLVHFNKANEACENLSKITGQSSGESVRKLIDGRDVSRKNTFLAESLYVNSGKIQKAMKSLERLGVLKAFMEGN